MYTMHTCLSADCVMHALLTVLYIIICCLHCSMLILMDLCTQSEEDSVCNCGYILY